MTESQQQLDASYYLAQMETCQKRADLYQGLATSVADGKLAEVPAILIASAFDDLFALGNQEKEEAKIAPAALDFVRACYRKNLVSSDEVIAALLYTRLEWEYSEASLQDTLANQELASLLLETTKANRHENFFKNVLTDVLYSPFSQVRAKAYENTIEAYGKRIISMSDVLPAVRSIKDEDSPAKKEGQQKLILLLAKEEAHILHDDKTREQKYSGILFAPLHRFLKETDRAVIVAAKGTLEELIARELLTVGEIASVLFEGIMVQGGMKVEASENACRGQEVVAICMEKVPFHVAQDVNMKNFMLSQSLSANVVIRQAALENMTTALTKPSNIRSFGKPVVPENPNMIMKMQEVVDYLKPTKAGPVGRQIVVSKLLDVCPEVAGNMDLATMVMADKNAENGDRMLASENFARMMRQPQGLRKVAQLPAPVQGS